MKKRLYELTEKDINLLLDIIPQCELFNVIVDSCKDYYGMPQSSAKKKAQSIITKLVRQREQLKKATNAATIN